MKKLEKLENFKVKNEKLNTILGGGPGSALVNYIASGTPTGGGESTFPEEGGCYCFSYTSDIDLPGGGRGYYGTQRNDKPC